MLVGFKSGNLEATRSSKNPVTGEIVAVPFHGSKEVGTRLAITLLKKLGKK